MKAQEFDTRIEEEDFFDVVGDNYKKVSLNEIIKKSFNNKEIFVLIKEKAQKIGVSPEKMAEILLAERLGII
ncbi:hypothetical protein [Nautilia sp.]